MRKNCLDCPVEITEDVFSEGNGVLADVLRHVTGAESPRIMLVADQNVVQHTAGLGTRIGRWVKAHNVELAGNPVIVMGGERAKADGFASATDIARALVRAKIGVRDAVVVLGGGTILDVTCWAASQVRGGLPVVRMPTTPLSMVDASFSEYAGIDLEGVKDAMRVPCRPAAVVIDTLFAATVLDGVWRAGFVSAVRVALSHDAALFKKLLKQVDGIAAHDASAMKEMVEQTVAARVKKGVSILGTWAALRLEAMSNYKLPHGYAVALGMLIDMTYSVVKGALTEADRKIALDALTASGAIEGAMHSKHLLSQEDQVLAGLDNWKLFTGTGATMVLTGLGKSEVDEKPDRETMKRVLNMLK